MLYQLTLTGNYNLSIDDLGIKLTPLNSIAYITEEQLAASQDLPVFTPEYVKVVKIEKAPEDKVVQPKSNSNVKEVPLPKVTKDNLVINATDASRSNSAKPTANKKTFAEEFQKIPDKDKDFIVADGAAKRGVTAPDKTTVVTDNNEEVKTSESKAEPIEKIDTVTENKTTESKAEPINAKNTTDNTQPTTAKKPGRPKKNK